jgi:hypothetical protein
VAEAGTFIEDDGCGFAPEVEALALQRDGRLDERGLLQASN